ncbi:inorganic pyrophosphatase [Candidatus Falkowbacteria bacterium]|nr:inorganic pyrophosphatase [Candidatus Falkowbacteria bacterium]
MANQIIDPIYSSFLNQVVTVTIDRPLGSKHPKHDLVYGLNYGFVPNTLAPDGEEIDAYVLGVDQPVENFTGRCIAIIHRLDDNDDKLVLASDGATFTDEEILASASFQERFFNSIVLRK